MSVDITARFRGGLPSSHLFDSDVTLGGTCLLKEFLARAAGQVGLREVTLVSPFLDVASITALGSRFGDRASQVSIRILTTPSRTNVQAVMTMADSKWRMWDAWGCRDLHAKIYVADPTRGLPVVLIGSHNFTVAGKSSNHEAGVLLDGRTPEIQLMTEGVLEYVRTLRTKSKLIHDSLQPALQAAC